MSTNVSEFLQELNAGVFEAMISRAISDVAMGVIEHDTKGQVTIKLDMKKIANSSQVAIAHSINYTKPTMRGKISEENTTSTPMYVNKGGEVTMFAKDQGDMFIPKDKSTLEQK